MEAIEAILTRRSVRSFDRRPIPDDVMQTLLECAFSAPTAGNEQPWHFIVIDDPELLEGVTAFHPYSSMLLDAPAAVLVCGDAGLLHYDGYMAQDLAAATENILVAARALGLGAVWLGIHPEADREEGCRRLLSIPREITPFALVAIGYSIVVQQRVKRYRAERVHTNGWG